MARPSTDLLFTQRELKAICGYIGDFLAFVKLADSPNKSELAKKLNDQLRDIQNISSSNYDTLSAMPLTFHHEIQAAFDEATEFVMDHRDEQPLVSHAEVCRSNILRAEGSKTVYFAVQKINAGFQKVNAFASSQPPVMRQLTACVEQLQFLMDNTEGCKGAVRTMRAPISALRSLEKRDKRSYRKAFDTVVAFAKDFAKNMPLTDANTKLVGATLAIVDAGEEARKSLLTGSQAR